MVATWRSRDTRNPSPLSRKLRDPFLQQIEIAALHPELTFVDATIDLHDGIVAGRRNAELFTFARNHAADELHLAPAAFDVIVDRRRAASADVAEQRFHGSDKVLVSRSGELVSSQTENRLDAIAERSADCKRFPAELHRDIEHARKRRRFVVVQ